eukprot:scaffold303496_cov18-Tisochrysis_lutea.AAC.2
MGKMSPAIHAWLVPCSDVGTAFQGAILSSRLHATWTKKCLLHNHARRRTVLAHEDAFEIQRSTVESLALEGSFYPVPLPMDVVRLLLIAVFLPLVEAIQ